MTGYFILITLSLFFLSWIAFDLYIVWTVGLESGQTISWTIYEASKKYPAIPFLTGLILGLLCGHFWLGMDD